MLNKYVMSKTQEKTFVKNNLNNFIYQSMILARYNVTKDYCIEEQDLNTEEGKALFNFKKAYKFILDNENLEASYSFLIDLHWILMDGLMDLINNELTPEQVDYLDKMINQPAKANTEIALDVMIYILNKRLFKDGDVRVALMFANKIMIDNGCGFITIPTDKCEEFRRRYKESEASGNTDDFKMWLATNCIKGIKNDY